MLAAACKYAASQLQAQFYFPPLRPAPAPKMGVGVVSLAQRGFGGGRKGGSIARLGLAPSRGTIAACALACLLAAGVGAWGMGGRASQGEAATVDVAAEGVPGADPEEAAEGGAAVQEAPEPAAVLVHVDGAVARPGLVELRKRSPRANDAVEAAGGLLDDADCTSLNLAAEVRDGEKIHVPHEGEAAGSVGTASVIPTGGRTEGQLVNLNTADVAALQSLPGVGSATARAIIEDREAHGDFASVDDLARVSGIGQKKLERIRDHACI